MLLTAVAQLRVPLAFLLAWIFAASSPTQCLVSSARNSSKVPPGQGLAGVFNVLDYGAVADNKTDLGPPLMKAFAASRASQAGQKSPSSAVILVPAGDYSLASNVVFEHGVSLTFTFQGTINLAYDPKLTGNMIEFHRCSHIQINGKGRFNGNGEAFRAGGKNMESTRPRLVRFDSCEDVEYSEFNLYDAPMFHLVVRLGTNFRLHHFEIESPALGTLDGVSVSGSNIKVHDLVVKAGDECVTAKSPMDGLTVENIKCINTAGCALGSFKDQTGDYQIRNVAYRNVELTRASHGAVVKSYPSSSGVIENVTFQNFLLHDVAYGIKLDYNWGPVSEAQHARMGKTLHMRSVSSGKQAWSNIKYINFTGTVTRGRAPVTLNCPPNSVCKDIQFTQVAISGSATPAVVRSACGSVDSVSKQLLPRLPMC